MNQLLTVNQSIHLLTNVLYDIHFLHLELKDEMVKRPPGSPVINNILMRIKFNEVLADKLENLELEVIK